MPRYTFTRRSIVEEAFEIVAKSEQEALDRLIENNDCAKVVDSDWIDWADDDFNLVNVEDEIVMFTNGENVNG